MTNTLPQVLPDLRTVLLAFRQEVLASLNCHLVGRIVAFDSATQTASVAPSMMRIQPDGSQVAYPVLSDCPVQFPFGTQKGLTFPVAVGDPCLVLFHDRDMDNWFVSGGALPPNSRRMHSLSDGLCLVGFRAKATPISDYDDDAVALRNGAASVKLFDDETVVAESGDGAKITLDDKVKLETSSGSLNTVFTAIITALTALNGKTGPSAATQIAAAQTAMNNLTS